MDWDVRRFATLGSTNTWLMGEAAAGASEGLVAVAGFQSGGRGRLGRAWEAPPDSGLLCSVLFRPALPPNRLHLPAAAVALAAASACAEVAGVRPGLKWPNDLVVGDAKLGGLLAESAGGAVVVGLGINLTWSPPGAAALGAVDPGELLAALLARLDELYGDGPAVASAYRRACTTLGRLVRVELTEETFTGSAADITDEGHLLVDVGACTRTVAAGDVVHLRPT